MYLCSKTIVLNGDDENSTAKSFVKTLDRLWDVIIRNPLRSMQEIVIFSLYLNSYTLASKVIKSLM